MIAKTDNILSKMFGITWETLSKTFEENTR